jgi:hypothetical protein
LAISLIEIPCRLKTVGTGGSPVGDRALTELSTERTIHTIG